MNKLSKEEEVECQDWIQFVKDNIVQMFKHDKEVHPHALIFAPTEYLDKIARKNNNDLKKYKTEVEQKI